MTQLREALSIAPAESIFGAIAALRQAAVPRVSTPILDFDWLVTRYQASPEWANFAEATKRVRRSFLRLLLTSPQDYRARFRS